MIVYYRCYRPHTREGNVFSLSVQRAMGTACWLGGGYPCPIDRTGEPPPSPRQATTRVVRLLRSLGTTFLFLFFFKTCCIFQVVSHAAPYRKDLVKAIALNDESQEEQVSLSRIKKGGGRGQTIFMKRVNKRIVATEISNLCTIPHLNF